MAMRTQGTIKYPENLKLNGMIALSGRTKASLAKNLGVSRGWLNMVVLGHEKGEELVKRLEEELTKSINQ